MNVSSNVFVKIEGKYLNFRAKNTKIVILVYADAAEVHEAHVHDVRHVGVGGLLSVVVVPDANTIFFITLKSETFDSDFQTLCKL